jgi:hypothetical protein
MLTVVCHIRANLIEQQSKLVLAVKDYRHGNVAGVSQEA